jgi:drug/metabolite transporter (DMT)-like permease
MDETVTRNVMILAAIATPVVAALIFGFSRWAAEDSRSTFSPKTRRLVWILALAGPLNLLLWQVRKGGLNSFGGDSAMGWILAAMVFIVAGYASGWFRRSRRPGQSSTHEDSPSQVNSSPPDRSDQS